MSVSMIEDFMRMNAITVPPRLGLAGVTPAVLLRKNGSQRYTYEPGNGTRYEVHVAGLRDGVVLVALLRHGAYRFYSPPHPDYVAVKLGIGLADAAAVAALLHDIWPSVQDDSDDDGSL